jgi:SpoVK/Ycf46/Vps4 family AAA+-type ATPase
LAYGPPGGGKDATASYIAELLGMEVMYRRASDLFSSGFGDTEQNIRTMFEKAKDLGSFLHVAEADSLFQDRRKVEYSWQVPIINEMLANVESHPNPCFFFDQSRRES